MMMRLKTRLQYKFNICEIATVISLVAVLGDILVLTLNHMLIARLFAILFLSLSLGITFYLLHIDHQKQIQKQRKKLLAHKLLIAKHWAKRKCKKRVKRA